MREALLYMGSFIFGVVPLIIAGFSRGFVKAADAF
jgi:hypothetical protein